MGWLRRLVGWKRCGMIKHSRNLIEDGSRRGLLEFLIRLVISCHDGRCCRGLVEPVGGLVIGCGDVWCRWRGHTVASGS